MNLVVNTGVFLYNGNMLQLYKTLHPEDPTATETIRICKDRNVLREYLQDREKEVVSIMMSLFDEEEVMRSYIRSERYEAEQESFKEAARTMIKLGKITIDEVESYFPKLSSKSVQELEAEIMQLAQV